MLVRKLSTLHSHPTGFASLYRSRLISLRRLRWRSLLSGQRFTNMVKFTSHLTPENPFLRPLIEYIRLPHDPFLPLPRHLDRMRFFYLKPLNVRLPTPFTRSLFPKVLELGVYKPLDPEHVRHCNASSTAIRMVAMLTVALSVPIF